MIEKPIPGTNRPIWDAEATHPDLCDQLRKGLSEITDPKLVSISFNLA